MLRRVEIDGYRSCQSVVLDDLTPLTALIGRNGAGKTNVLKAIETAAQTAGREGARHDSFDWVTPGLRISLGFSAGGRDYRYTVAHPSAGPAETEESPSAGLLVRDAPGSPVCERLEARGHSSDPWISVVDRRGEAMTLRSSVRLRLGRAAAALPTLHLILPSDDPSAAELLAARSFLAGVHHYELEPEADTPVTFDAYVKWHLLYMAGQRRGPTTLKLLHLFAALQERAGEFTSLLGEAGLGLIERIEFDRSALPEPGAAWEKARARPSPPQAWSPIPGLFGPTTAGTTLGPTFHLAGGAFTFHQLSAGTRRIVALVASLLVDDSSVLLVEHPENDVHAGLVHKLVGLLHTYADPATILLSTHSTTLMDQLEPQECRLVTMRDGATRVRGLSPEEIAGARAYLEDTGSLADFLATAEQI